jgi:poly(3-hydroxybutyrate) depolymerase
MAKFLQRPRWLCAAALIGMLGCQPTAGSEPGAAGAGGSGGSGNSAGSGGRGGSDVTGTGGSATTAGGSGGYGGGMGSSTGGSGGSGTGGSGGSGAGGSSGSGSGGASADAAAERSSMGDAAAGEAGPAVPGTGGCGKRNAAGTFMIMAGAAQTPYRVVLPTNYDPMKPYPLVFYLHGRGNNIEGQGNLTRDVAGANLGIVVYPKSYASSGWEVPGRDRPEENVALLRALIRHMGDQYCVDAKKVILTGFSSGCWLASRLACTMKDEWAGVVAAGCGLDPMGRCMDRKPFTYIIGRGDGQFAGSAAAAEFYRTRNGCQMTRKPAGTAPCELYDGCAAPATYCPHPGGHMWPGFASKAVIELVEKL